jgi:hypothetical protein
MCSGRLRLACSIVFLRNGRGQRATRLHQQIAHSCEEGTQIGGTLHGCTVHARHVQAFIGVCNEIPKPCSLGQPLRQVSVEKACVG